MPIEVMTNKIVPDYKSWNYLFEGLVILCKRTWRIRYRSYHARFV